MITIVRTKTMNYHLELLVIVVKELKGLVSMVVIRYEATAEA
jgi:hypothetical protein